MNIFALSGLINGIVLTVCGLAVFFNRHKSKKSRAYILYCLSGSVWSYSYCIWQLCETSGGALFWSRALMMGAIFIPLFHYQHFLTLFDLETPKRILLIKVARVLTGIFFVSNFTPLFVAKVEQRFTMPFWPVPGPLFHPYLIMFYVLVLLSVLLVWEYRKKAAPIERNRVNWIAITCLIGYGGASANFFLWYNIPVLPYTNSLVLLYVAIPPIIYLNLRLIDLQLAIRDTLVHVLTSLIIGSVGAIFIHIVTRNYWMSLFQVGFALVVPLVYSPVAGWVRKKVNLTPLGKVDYYLGSLGENLDKIRETTYTYDDLAKNIVSSVLKTFPVKMAAVYFMDFESQELQLRYHVGMTNPFAKDLKYHRKALAIPKSDPLLEYLATKKNIVIREEIKIDGGNGPVEKLAVSTMEKIEAEACVPFLFAGQVMGLLALDRKSGNKMFHQQDQVALYSYGRMGEEIMRYIMGMEHELRNTAMYSHDMANDTKSLALLVSHLLDPISENSPRERIRKHLQDMLDIIQRLDQTFDLHRNRSQLILKSVKGEYDRFPIDIVKACQVSCSQMEILAKERSINLVVNLPGGPIIVNGNEKDLTRVVTNLLGNALRYVKTQDKIKVDGDVENGYFKLAVSDDGEGIDPKDLEQIWNFGWQAKDPKQGASGLGLAIARQIVYLHKGRIWAESAGKGMGTKFTFIIPTLEVSEKGENNQEVKSNGV